MPSLWDRNAASPTAQPAHKGGKAEVQKTSWRSITHSRSAAKQCLSHPQSDPGAAACSTQADVASGGFCCCCCAVSSGKFAGRAGRLACTQTTPAHPLSGRDTDPGAWAVLALLAGRQQPLLPGGPLSALSRARSQLRKENMESHRNQGSSIVFRSA